MSHPRRRLVALAVGLLLGAIPLAQAKGGRGTVRLYKANGRYAGRVDPGGRFYGENGRYLGRVEGNRIYSAQGRYRGRFEESGVSHDAADRPATASRAGAPRADDPRNVVSGHDGDHGSPPAVLSSDPSAGTPLIEIVRPDKGTR